MKTEKYIKQKKRLPEKGRQVIGSHDTNSIIVYQAFKPQIANYAVSKQKFGGDHYSFNRMSWIKPGFLWMMYRAGWASKEDQQHILAITFPMSCFKMILQQATISSFDGRLFVTEQDWKKELAKTDVRLQWDPDHDPYGNKLERKAIQIGMKGETLKKFCTEWISKIEDITGFVKEEYAKVANQQIEELNVPYEDVVDLKDPAIEERIGIESQ
ncbi:DUF4291 domain-containing protein [Terrimonas pollutisoli]|uniref:DUF4291 domain-containing protein n=1 Tax=Terrimonas pollutisoli TaxID=3034147 RepID=UPI0023EC04BD|nr:DUF4291 domain-containing protein [Terrimonas sp. H1YJ31]